MPGLFLDTVAVELVRSIVSAVLNFRLSEMFRVGCNPISRRK